MEEFSQEQKDEIINVLEKRGAIKECPRCGHEHFTITDGYMTHSIQEKLGDVRIGGPSIPTIAAICANCGFISEHALGVLGLLEDYEKEVEDEQSGE